MPELPEVNTVALALHHHLKGDSPVRWQKNCTKLRKPVPDSFEAKKLLHLEIKRVFRQAKSIFFEFNKPVFLHFHLGMTGYFVLKTEPGSWQKH